jgi:hypothetical protein
MADEPDQFAYLAESIGHVSDVQAQNTFMIATLVDKEKIKACKDSEEEDGRVNCDMLHRFVIVGGPFIPVGPNSQEGLIKQVFCHFLFICIFILLIS